MSRALRCAVCFALLSLGSFPAVAFSSMLSVGASLGLAIFMPPENGDNIVMLEVPGNAGQFFPGLMPGFRFTISDDAGANAVVVEPSMNLLSSGGSTITQLEEMLSYQRAFAPRSSTSGFLNLGGGVLFQSFESENASNLVIGGGLGVRTRSRHGHGQGRAEVRFDHVTEDTNDFVGGNVFSIKFGFDLDTR